MRRPVAILALAALALAQQDYGGGDYGDSYQDYAEQDDGLYANYAAKQQAKEMG